jgi:hypothetical protein
LGAPAAAEHVIEGQTPTTLCRVDSRDGEAADDVQCLPPAPIDGNQGSLNTEELQVGGRKLLLQAATSSEATSDTPVVQLDVVLTSGNVQKLIVEANPAHSTARSTMCAGLLGAGQLLASGLEQQAAGGSSNPAGGVPQLLRVMLAQRVGVCGNGLCEVGERQLLNAEGEVLQEAAAPCAQDCPGTFMLCPAPVGPVGYPDRECGGNGRCIRETGTCDCSAG